MAHYQLPADEPQDSAAAPHLDFADEATLPDAPTDDVALCPHCGELLAWHEQACQQAAPPQLEEDVVIYRQGSVYAFELGRAVQPLASARGRIIWRGQIKEREPASGFVVRINVYGLNNGFWDCYREEDLQAA